MFIKSRQGSPKPSPQIQFDMYVIHLCIWTRLPKLIQHFFLFSLLKQHSESMDLIFLLNTHATSPTIRKIGSYFTDVFWYDWWSKTFHYLRLTYSYIDLTLRVYKMFGYPNPLLYQKFLNCTPQSETCNYFALSPNKAMFDINPLNVL